jgi:hypothetical protein
MKKALTKYHLTKGESAPAPIDEFLELVSLSGLLTLPALLDHTGRVKILDRSLARFSHKVRALARLTVLPLSGSQPDPSAVAVSPVCGGTARLETAGRPKGRPRRRTHGHHSGRATQVPSVWMQIASHVETRCRRWTMYAGCSCADCQRCREANYARQQREAARREMVRQRDKALDSARSAKSVKAATRTDR